MRRFLAGLTCLLTVLPACGGDDGGDSTSASAGSTSGTTGDATTDPTGGEDMGGTTVMGQFGLPCMEDSDCVAALGPDGKCLKDILSVYALPGGYCSRLCMLPDAATAYVKDDPTCGMGVYCIGADGFFEGCAVECTDNSQCPRTGYECRIMPQIGKDGDPKFCLMTEDNMIPAP